MKFVKFRVCLLVALVFCASAFAHKPLLSVDDNEDGTIYIEVGFSDGASGSGHDLILKDMNGKVIDEMKVPEESALDVDMPVIPYTVTFSAGEGHIVTVDGPFVERGSDVVGKVSDEVESTSPDLGVTLQDVPAQMMTEPAMVPSGVVATHCCHGCASKQSNIGQGFDMAFKMLITTNICIAVFVAFLLALCAFWVGYSVAKSKK